MTENDKDNRREQTLNESSLSGKFTPKTDIFTKCVISSLVQMY